jgi:hypothetical protein
LLLSHDLLGSPAGTPNGEIGGDLDRPAGVSVGDVASCPAQPGLACASELDGGSASAVAEGPSPSPFADPLASAAGADFITEVSPAPAREGCQAATGATQFSYAAPSGNGPDQLILRYNSGSGELEIVDVVTSSVLASQALADTTDVLVAGADAENDTLTIDFTTAFTIDVEFRGGAGGTDRLVIQGGSFAAVVYKATGAGAGAIDFDSLTVTYSGLEPIADGSVAASRVFVGTAGGESIRLGDDGVAGNGLSRIDDNGTGAFEEVTFRNPTGSLTITAGGGGDTIILGSMDSLFAASISVNGEEGNDTLIAGAGDEALAGGAGDDVYVFADGWGVDTVTELTDGGDDVLDFSACTGPLTSDTDGAGHAVLTGDGGLSTVTHSDANCERLIGADLELDAGAKDALQAGLAELVSWGGSLADYDLLARALPLISQDQRRYGLGEAGEG